MRGPIFDTVGAALAARSEPGVAVTLELGIVVPCFNEEEVLPETARRLLALLGSLADDGLAAASSAIYFVDDGSTDRTWSLIEALAASDARVHGIKLAHNRGHQNALLAGLLCARGDALVSIDADLQDDVAVIRTMVERHRAGSEIVFGVRRSRQVDSRFKRGSAESYYRFLALLGVDIVHNHADYRLMGRRALQALGSYSEVNLFLRGIVPLLGFPTSMVHYDRAERYAGESKYPLRKMLALAADGITSFSVAPLRLIALLGMVVSFFSIVMVGWVLYGKLVMQTAIPGWASSVIPIYFLGGVQLLSIGILGEYVAKIYLETKRRPRYTVEATI